LRERRLIPVPLRTLLLAGVLGLVAGCSVMRVSAGPRTVAEQQLIVRSLDRAAAALDLERFRGKRVTLSLHGLTADRDFAREFLAARMAEQGVIVVGPGIEADLDLTVLATAIGIEQSENLVGVPALTVPLLGMTLPELRLFKWARNRGVSELQIQAYDAATDTLVVSTPMVTGRSRYDAITVLLVFTFRYSDLRRYPVQRLPE
jgi:hypothetical protein